MSSFFWSLTQLVQCLCAALPEQFPQIGRCDLGQGSRIRQPGIVQDRLLEALLLADNGVADIPQHLGGTVLALLDIKEGRGLLNELGMALARYKGRVGEDIVEEGHIGLDAADADLAHTTLGLAHRSLKGAVKGGDLYQQRVIVRGDLRTGEGVACVQADAEAAAGTVGGELAGIRGKVVGGVLGGDTALDGIAVLPDGLLVGNADIRGTEGIALRHQNLSLHQVHTCDHLSDSMLHLNTGIISMK